MPLSVTTLMREPNGVIGQHLRLDLGGQQASLLMASRVIVHHLQFVVDLLTCCTVEAALFLPGP